MTPPRPNSDFRCAHCSNIVMITPALSAVHNRNHCPYCLWSRHLDLYAAGDRLSACKAPMRPLGLTMKPAHNKYAPGGGELMLIHACTDCSRLSINRIAADDDADTLLGVFTQSLGLSSAVRSQMIANGIRLLGVESQSMLRRQLSAPGVTWLL
jgi:hypothetical protein